LRFGLDPQSGARRSAFTLIELLIAIAMIAVLLGIILPALGRTMEAGRAFKCQMSMRSVAMDFQAFADDMLHADRGDDQDGERFHLETFQESEYAVHEFWKWEDEQFHVMPDAAGNDPMRCPSIDGDLVLKKNVACSKGAVSPPQNVSFGFNARLHRAEVTDDQGNVKAADVKLDARVLEMPGVPLLWDVDGRVATQKGVSPVFSAPALDSKQLYKNDKYWFPGMRHNGGMNVAFIDGRVESTARPLEESASGWQWGAQFPYN
jgi:prepilin-type N-terminal cleavage/methylation domain-containing protein/prepilin-type processing-associated H-X9-DG protein